MLWRDTMRPARLGPFDARVSYAVVLFLAHIALWTAAIVVMAAVLFLILEWRGLTAPAAWRMGRSWLIGQHRPVLPPWKRRRLIDFEGR